MMKRTLSRSFWIASAITMLTFARIPAEEPKPASLLGRWDMTVVALRETYPSWLEVRLSGRKTLVGSYVGQFGSARPIANIQFDSGKMSFSVPPQWEGRKHDVAVEGQLDGDTLRGTITDDDGHKLTWTARRAPLLKREHEPTWGEAIELFNGKDLAGWKPKHDGQKHGWIVKDGLLINDKPAVDLVTEQKFDDFKLHAEFRYPKKSNSGIYLRGRYEVQIEDNYGDEPDCHKIGGVYGFLTPSLNMSKKPGEWQSMDITLVGRTLTLVFNGERVIDRQAIPGITGGAIDSNEGEPGPIMLQGDHGKIEFRKVTIATPK